jgi:purine nucleoside phosphorylase
MTMARIAVLCGTGMSALADDLSAVGESETTILLIDTDWGQISATLASFPGGDSLIIDRHNSEEGLRTPPHEIEHRANVHAATSCNPDLVMSVNSVGSMSEDLPPGTIGISGDVLDLAVRPWTFHDGDATHSDRTSPFDASAMAACSDSLAASQGSAPSGIIVAQCVGPQFESIAEIDALERLGADVVGMTLGPESRLLSETGIPHVSLVCSSNWAAGRQPGNPSGIIDHDSVESMASTMRQHVTGCLLFLMGVK